MKPKYDSSKDALDQPFEIIVHRKMFNNVPMWEVMKVYYNRMVSLGLFTIINEACRYAKCYDRCDHIVDTITFSDNA